MSNYHTHSIEDYQFTHGHHRIVSSGKYIALHPHFLGRPLTHEEMDFNLLYAEQTLAGFRIFGSNADLTLSDDDLGKSLVFHKIASNDDDFARYTAAGYTEGQYIWIPDCCGGTPIDCSTFQVSSITATDTGGYSCGDFVVDSITATDSGGADDCISFVVDNIVATDSEGGTSVPNPTPVPPTPTATEVPATPTATATEVPATPTATAEMTPTPTATNAFSAPTPTATNAFSAPTPTPTVESTVADTFNWVVSTDVDSLNRVNYIEENFDNDQYGVWASNEELQLKHYQYPGISFNYFPVEAGQSYYIKLETNNPNGRFTISSVTGRNALNSVYLFNDDPIVIHTIDSVWNKATDSTRPDVAFLNNNNEAVDNQCAYDNEGLVKIYNKLDTNNGTDSTICSSNGYLNPENYIKIDVPTNASPGEEFTIGWGGLQYWPNWAQGQTDITDTESVGATQITPGQSTGSIQFRVVENPTEPTVTPTPLPSDNKLPINLVRSIGTLGNVADSTYSDTQAFLIEKNYDPTSWSGVNERTSGNPYAPQTGDILYDDFSGDALNPLPNGTFAFVKAVPLGIDEWFWITTDSNGIMTVTQL